MSGFSDSTLLHLEHGADSGKCGEPDSCHLHGCGYVLHMQRRLPIERSHSAVLHMQRVQRHHRHMVQPRQL